MSARQGRKPRDRMAGAALPRTAGPDEFDVMVLDRKLDALRVQLRHEIASYHLLAADETRQAINRVLDRRLVAMRGEAA